MREEMLERFRAHGRKSGAANQVGPGRSDKHLSYCTSGLYICIRLTLPARRSARGWARRRATFRTLGSRAAPARCAGCTR